MSFLPETQEETAQATPEPREYAYDFEKNCLKTRGGKYYTVSGVEALKIWAFKTLATRRGQYEAYTAEYGQRLDTAFGETNRERIEHDIARLLEDALLNDYITAVKDLTFAYSGSRCTVGFTVCTIYGDFAEQLETPTA